MRIIIRFILVTISICILISCCNEHDDNSGIIIINFNIGDDSQKYDCLNLPDTICICDDSTYRAVFKITSTNSKCNDIVIPNVDFTIHSVLIYQKSLGGRIYYHRNVQVDSLNKIVIYSISTTKCFCADVCENNDQNIVLVPKIGKDYKIKYK